MPASRTRFIAWLAISGLVALGLAFAFWPRAIAVDIAEVAQGPMQVTVSEEGRTRVREVYVVSAPLTGRLQRVTTHAGDATLAGETIVARLEPTDPTFLDIRTRAQAQSAAKAAEAALALATAEVDRARAELDLARSELRRTEILARNGTVSAAALDRARTNARTKRTALSTATAALDVRRFELETAKALLIDPTSPAGSNPDNFVALKAPESGVVLSVIQESEGVVAAGAPLLEIGDPAELEIIVDLISEDAIRVRSGAKAQITGWGGGVALTGVVRRVEPTAFTKISALGVEEQRVNVRLDIESPRERWSALGHGYRVDAAIVVWEADGIIKVPVGALFRHDSSWAVFTVERGRARLRIVEIGQSNDENAEVSKGLAAGEQVILHPSDRVHDGRRVHPRSD